MATNWNNSARRTQLPRPRRAALGVVAAAAAVVVGPHAVDVTRAVANLPLTAASVAWSRAHHGDCDLHRNLLVSCGSMQGGFANAGTTVGNAWMYDDLGSAERARHEGRHSDQWAMLGPGFAGWYVTDCVVSRGNYRLNVFERWAGLHDGGYIH